ncbi:unnamed protein product [Nezara viridula]|uniref:Uncharacterized protein n=1 Tax=Nezara viridula TaxID=85310 RepID=A0A9P0MSJ2_NEZVI|nr:unnamed protein product [Nezara viridula]
MSIHVTVSGNPVYLGRGKVLLTDIETAKKNEWLRRRKIRLQQARQQAKDLTQSVRRRVSSEESALQKDEEEKENEEQNRRREEQIACLHNEYQKSLSTVGTGHHLASMQDECDALAREKQDLRDAIAKARGAIAEERIKAEKCIKKEMSQITLGRKKMVRQMEDLRSAVVSNLPEVKPSVSQMKSSTIKVQIHQSEDPEDEREQSVCSKKVVLPTKKFSQRGQREFSKARSSLSPPRSARNRPSSRGRRSNVAEEDSDEDDSDDSDVTWPPRSARVTKEPIEPPEPPRVRFYDHNARIAKQTSRPSYSVTKVNPFEEPDMCEAIAEEEEAVVRKENLDILARREKMIRGNKALKQERGRREAEKFLKELREIHRKEKIQMAVSGTYPSDLHMRDCRRKEMEIKNQAELHKSILLPQGVAIKPPMPTSTNRNGIKIKSCELPTGGVKLTRLDPETSPLTKDGDPPESPKKIYQDSSTDNEEFFRELVSKLKAERARQQQELEAKFGAINVEEEDIPQWIRCQEEAGPSGIRVVPVKQDRAVSPVKCQTVCEVCSCSSECTRCPRNDNNIQEQKGIAQPRNSVSPQARHPTNVDKEFTKDPKNENLPLVSDEKDVVHPVIEAPPSREQVKTPQDVSMAPNSPRLSDGAELECEMVSSKSSSNSDAVESSLTFEGIKVTVKVSEKLGKKKDRLSTERSPKTTDKDIQTSLEYCEESPVSRNMTWNNQFSSREATSSGSTSYMSPPNKLSPAHQALLRAILGKIDAKNKNPRLHQYIKRVLEMSRKSIDELPTSSVSDISISSSIFDRSTRRRPSSIGECPKVCKCHVSPQAHANVSDDSTTKEALKFSEMAEGYAHRVQDLAKMMERIRILPDCRTGDDTEDSSYLSPPPEVHHSVRLSQSVKAGVYPTTPADESGGVAQRVSPCYDLPPAHIYPHPSTATHLHPSSSHSSNSRKFAGLGSAEVAPHELSTIQECGESQRPETPQPCGFDPDISSIRGSPRQHGSRDSTGSSLCLLDDRDMSSWLGSSSDNFEEVFRSLGIAWALPTVRKTRQSQRRTSGSQSSSRSGGRGQYSHSTPLGQSPAKPSSAHQCHTASADSDSLTPPTLTLNIPQSVWHNRRCSK